MADPNCFLNLALFCGLCLLRVFAQEAVDTHPVQDVFVAEGNDVQFPALGPLDGPEVNVVLCDVHHGATNTMLLNYYRGSPVELTSRFVNRSGLSLADGVFRLHEVRLSDQAIYSFRINLGARKFYRLHVLTPVSAPNIQRNASVFLPDVQLVCAASGSNLTRRWMKEALPLPPDCHLSSDNTTLLIRNATATHNGNFSCSVENRVSSRQTHFNLIIGDGGQNFVHTWIYIVTSLLVWLCS
uniref:Uncharacterized LOC103189479 n=1 Tax=Callorhinchus milii TaxID=7868 RepID=V9KWT5_CALMI|eukprot:gi/632982351/ref/XP_007908088.1/ PREDICTED: uncharacterized protein LOC103189479 [Callorhinchus milii]